MASHVPILLTSLFASTDLKMRGSANENLEIGRAVQSQQSPTCTSLDVAHLFVRNTCRPSSRYSDICPVGCMEASLHSSATIDQALLLPLLHDGWLMPGISGNAMRRSVYCRNASGLWNTSSGGCSRCCEDLMVFYACDRPSCSLASMRVLRAWAFHPRSLSWSALAGRVQSNVVYRVK